MHTILLIDDESAIRHAFQRAFPAPDFDLQSEATLTAGLRALKDLRADVVILDLHLPDVTGLNAFERVREVDSRVPVILITGHGTTELAIEAIKLGAYEYLLKPLELAPLRELVDRACATSRLMRTPAVVADVAPVSDRADALVGRCAAMQEVYKAIGRVAGQNVTVLILGESGTGKELVARAIYQHGPRAEKPFLAVNCAAIPESLLESELFGHERGAFTGADRKRIGKFEQCNDGTLFLDEVGDMTPLTQTKVLRLVQEQQFERVGGTETIRTDVRLIAATNVNIEAMVAAGRFRGDLFYRLSVFTIRLPPLRERTGDLPLLVDYFLRRFCRELQKEVHSVSAEAMEALAAYSWPGNLRELQSVLKQALLVSHGPILQADCLPPNLRAGSRAQAAAASDFWEEFFLERLQKGSTEIYAEALQKLDRWLIPRVLQHTGGNQLQAAKLLGITRGSVRNKMRAMNLTIHRLVESPDDPSEGVDVSEKEGERA